MKAISVHPRNRWFPDLKKKILGPEQSIVTVALRDEYAMRTSRVDRRGLANAQAIEQIAALFDIRESDRYESPYVELAGNERRMWWAADYQETLANVGTFPRGASDLYEFAVACMRWSNVITTSTTPSEAKIAIANVDQLARALSVAEVTCELADKLGAGVHVRIAEMQARFYSYSRRLLRVEGT